MQQNNRIIAAYVRESTKDQAINGFNLVDQKRKIQSYLDVYSDEFAGDLKWFEEGGASAKSLNRPQFNQIIDLIRSDSVSALIVHNLDRLTRRVKDLATILELLEAHHVKLISITEKIDTETAQGKFFIYLIVLIAQWEQDTISERTKRGIYSSSAEGNFAKSHVPFGYRRVNKTIEIDPDRKPIVDDLFKLALSNQYSISGLATYMDVHYPTQGVWTQDRVMKIVKSPIYKGQYVIGDKIYDEFTDRYLTDAQWDRLQIIVSSLTHRYFEHEFIFKNYLFCDVCEHPLCTSTTNKGTSKRTYFYYYCDRCHRRVNQTYVLKEFALQFNQYLLGKVNVKLTKEYRLKSARLTSRINGLKTCLRRGDISDSEYRRRLNLLMEEQKKQDAEMRLKYQSEPRRSIDLTPFETLTFKEKRSLLEKYVDHILVTSFKPLKIRIIYK